jgi:N-acylglucosamine-6-phosphate 2-epimerase
MFWRNIMIEKRSITEVLQRGLVVSCQALDDEPLHSSYIMSRMAVAAKEGGAIGIRANSKEDIIAIKKEVDLPIIGILKKVYGDSNVYITPTIMEVAEIVESGAEVIALDATKRERPDGKALDEFIKKIKNKFPEVYIMADVSDYEEGLKAAELGFDLISTTLSGYTDYTKNRQLPDIDLIKRLSEDLDIPIIAEGGIWTVEDSKNAYNAGAYALVVGSAITRPQLITKRFVNSITDL